VGLTCISTSATLPLLFISMFASVQLAFGQEGQPSEYASSQTTTRSAAKAAMMNPKPSNNKIKYRCITPPFLLIKYNEIS